MMTNMTQEKGGWRQMLSLADKWGREGRKIMTMADKGGRAVWTPPFLADKICEHVCNLQLYVDITFEIMIEGNGPLAVIR